VDDTLTPISALEACTKVVQTLSQAKPHENPSHALSWGIYTNGRSAPQELVLQEGIPVIELLGEFGKTLKRMGITAEIIILINNVMLPAHTLRPAVVVVARTRWADYAGLIYDYKKKETLAMSSINREYREALDFFFLSQATYHPEIDMSARWN
jgi:hypothetical protein